MKRIPLTSFMREPVQQWIRQLVGIAMSTGPTDRQLATGAVHGLYQVCGMPCPRVVFVPSPFAMAFAGGFAAGVWHWRRLKLELPLTAVNEAASRIPCGQAGQDAVLNATDAATRGLRDAPFDWIDDRTDSGGTAAQWDAAVATTKAAVWGSASTPHDSPNSIAWAKLNLGTAALLPTLESVRQAIIAATDVASAITSSHEAEFLLICAALFERLDSEVGPWLGHFDLMYLALLRDIGALPDPPAGLAHYQTLAMLSGPRIAHGDFCIVSDRPEALHTILRDGSRLLHNDAGPACRWSDGWELWSINGVDLPAHAGEQIVLRPQTQSIEQIDTEENEEVRRIRIERFGWPRYLAESQATVIDSRRNDIENTQEMLCKRPHMRVLVCHCPSTGRIYALEVPPEIRSCEQAQSWLWNTGESVYGPPRIIGRS